MKQRERKQSSGGSVPNCVVCAPHSLHVRPAARLVRLTQSFAANLSLMRGAQRVDAKSILEVLGLCIMEGDRLEVHAEGIDADEALEAIVCLFANNFEE